MHDEGAGVVTGTAFGDVAMRTQQNKLHSH